MQKSDRVRIKGQQGVQRSFWVESLAHESQYVIVSDVNLTVGECYLLYYNQGEIPVVVAYQVIPCQ